MIRIINKKGTGKTNQLMQLAQEQNAIFVCSNPSAMAIKAKAYNIENIQFMSYEDFLHNYDPEIHSYVVDELETFIQTIFFNGPNLIGYTLSEE